MNATRRMTVRSLKVLVLACATVSIACLVACNTVEGVGKDVQQAGAGIEGAAEGASD
ncbi:MAG: entericidin A/B family lipoprotein [Phycisphaerales bacterium]|nr:entericidin A/B family lipoprotein [Phycisphaerales bacterium]